MTGISLPTGTITGDRLLAWLGRLRRAPLGTLVLYGAIVILIILALVGPHIGPYGPEEVDPGASLQPPSGRHWLGTDRSGLDIFSRILAAPQTNLVIALTATAISVGIGVPVGAVAGFFAARGGPRGFLSELVMRAMDVLQSFPVLIFALALVAVSGQSTRNVIWALSVVNLPVFVRLTRADMLTVREQPYAEAARCLGHSNMRIIFRHLLPNALGSSLAQVPVVIGFVILFTASLSFVGAGVKPPTAELGSMIKDGARNMITGQWWPSLFPGIALGLTVFTFALAAQDVGRRIRRVKRGQEAVPAEAAEAGVPRA